MVDLGIECYISNHIGFHGEIKQSCKDFQVVEIDEKGSEVCVLDNIDSIAGGDYLLEDFEDDHHEKLIPSKPETILRKIAFYKEENFMKESSIKEAQSKLSDIIGSNVLERMTNLSRTVQSDECITIGCFHDKAVRTEIHLYTRMVFPSIKTVTIPKDKLTAGIDPVFNELSTLITHTNDIKNLLRFCHCLDKNNTSIFNLPCGEDKECRRKIHRLLAKYFGSYLESKTFTSTQGKKAYIQVRRRSKQKSKEQNNVKSTFYTGFVLRKQNMETLEAIEKLSKSLGIYPSAFNFAGTKDKKAITMQNMTVKGDLAYRLSKANNEPALANLSTGSFKQVKEPLKLGQLKGNAFKIVIRDIQQNDNTNRSRDALRAHVTKAVENTATYGFINYFGPQRFGLEEGLPTGADQVGLAMLKGNITEAVDLLLTPDPVRLGEANEAKRYYQETKDISGTLTKMPSCKTRERLVLKSLHRHGIDQDGCFKALFSIPYSMRLMYIHSFTSLIWNKMASKRLQEYSHHEVVLGDLVYDSTNSLKAAHTDTKTNSGSTHKERVPNNYVKSISPEEKVLFTNPTINKSHVRVVSEDDLRNKKFTIRDLVLPIPGYNVLYPTNGIGKRYQEILCENELTENSFRLRSLGMALPGAYRRVIAAPRDLAYKWITEEEPSPTLSRIETICCRSEKNIDKCHSGENKSETTETSVFKNRDFEGCHKLKRSNSCSEMTEYNESSMAKRFKLENEMTDKDGSGQTKNTIKAKTKSCQEVNTSEVSEMTDTDGNLSIEVSFKLDSSCYATVCLREMMKPH